jgi:phage regulator Rha-like protein
MMDVAIIENKIYEIRGQKVMLDFDLAQLYQVETKALNQAVKRNAIRFPEDFMFRLTTIEWNLMWSQFVTTYPKSQIGKESMQSQFVTASQKKRNIQVTPFAFTEHGVTMLASVLRSERAIKMNIEIVRAFIAIRHYINKNKNISEQINDLRIEIQKEFGERDVQIASIYDALENLLDKKEDEIEQRLKWEQRERIGFKK